MVVSIFFVRVVEERIFGWKMKNEKPILFKPEMVNAILHGNFFDEKKYFKTETRRKYKGSQEKCPYGQAGDFLWVKETYFDFGYFLERKFQRIEDPNNPIVYLADELRRNADQAVFSGYCPAPQKVKKYYNRNLLGISYHKRSSSIMSRRDSRLNLKIVSTELQKLGDMTELDAKAEGVESLDSFKKLWDKINSKRGFQWDPNSKVWVVRFEKV